MPSQTSSRESGALDRKRQQKQHAPALSSSVAAWLQRAHDAFQCFDFSLKPCHALEIDNSVQKAFCRVE